MKFGSSSNPVLSEKLFRSRVFESSDSVMTLGGVINKTILLLLLAVFSATYTWKLVMAGAVPTGLMFGGAIGGFIAALVVTFRPQLSAYVTPIYALLEGLFLGAISALYSNLYDGVVIKAVLLTFGIMFSMLFVYRSGLIKVNDKFKGFMSAAIGGIALFYLATWILGFFGMHVGSIFNGGIIGIGISLVIVVIASLSFLWDFDVIEKGVQAQAPKYMEWYSAFSLMVTLVWLYLELLRLLSQLSKR